MARSKAKARSRGNGQGTLFKRTAGGPWIASWYDHAGKRRTKTTGTTDKKAAERILGKYVSDEALRREGVVDPKLDALNRESRRPVEKHLTDYEAKLKAANRDAQHIRSTLGYIRRMAATAGWETAADIDADGASRHAQELRENGASARTVQAHLTAAKGFTRWLAAHQKLPADPLASVSRPDPKADRRRERRMLTPEEWDWLRPATADGPEHYGTSGRERVLLYATAIQTGLRANELRSLTRGRLHLDPAEGAPFVTCSAGSTKNSKPARQYIRAELATELREHVARKAPGAPVFAMPAEDKLADMLREDLAAARRAWLKAAGDDAEERQRREQADFLAAETAEGQHLDFHSLRHTCGAWLAMAGEHPKTVQAVMRHSSITLTMDTYGHLFPGQEAEAVGKLPKMLAAPAEPRAQKATGTMDATAEGAADAQQRAPATSAQTSAHTGENPDSARSSRRNSGSANGRETAQRGAGRTGGERSGEAEDKPFSDADLRDVARAGARERGNAPPRTRTWNQLIKSQLLCRLS